MAFMEEFAATGLLSFGLQKIYAALPADERAQYDKLAEEAKAAPPEHSYYWQTHTGIDTEESATHLLLASQVKERGGEMEITDEEAEASSSYVGLMLSLYTAFDLDELPPPGELRRRRWRPHILLRALCERGRATIGSSKRGSTRRALADAKLVFVYESCPYDVFKHIVECL